jgi:hypothetical protein
MAIVDRPTSRMEGGSSAPPYSQGSVAREVQPGIRPSEAPREVEKTAEFVAGGSFMEALCGAGGIVLGIIGLTSSRWVGHLAPISLIVLGAGLLFVGGAVAARYSKLFRAVAPDQAGKVELGGGISSEFLTGCAGIVLGILALLGFSPTTLMAVGVICLGAGVLVGSGSNSRLNALAYYGTNWHPTAQAVARESVIGAAATEALVGVGAVVLGILALLGYQPMTLILVSAIALGGSILLSGSAVGARMMSVFQH